MISSMLTLQASPDMTSVRWIRTVLVAILAALLFSAAYTTTLTIERQVTLQKVSRYNATWLASQASAQVVRFQERVAEYGLPGVDVDADEVKVRLDVLTNRVQVLTAGEGGELIGTDPALTEIVAKFAQAVIKADTLLGDLDKVETRVELLGLMEPLVADLARLAATLNQRSGDLVARHQHDLNHLHWVFSTLMIGVVACAVTLLFFVSWIHKRFVRQLLAAKETAEAANAAKSRFLANMSHELRTPMNGVLGTVELIKQGTLTSEQRRFADIAHQSGKVMLDLIATILDHSKIEAGQLDLVEGAVDMRDVVENATDMQRADAITKGLSLTTSIAADVPASLMGDAGRLRQVMINLVGNAVKFTQTGEVTVKVTVEDADDESVSLRCEVRDTGVGIAADQLQRVFEAFAQADDSSTRRKGGTGLGLAIARQLMELMGGKIGVISQPGKGSLFWFTVPLRRPLGEEAPRDQDAAPIAALAVLVLTADEHERNLVTEYLSAWTIWPVCTDTGERALTLARRAAAQGRGFDQMLVSETLPDMSQEDFISALRSDPSLAAVAILTMGGSKEPGVSLSRPVQRSALYHELCATAARREANALSHKPLPRKARVKKAGARKPSVRKVSTRKSVARKLAAGGTVAVMDDAMAPDAVPSAASLSAVSLSAVSRDARAPGDAARPAVLEQRKPVSIHDLLVEDNPVNRLVASEYLKRAGCAVDLAVHGREAVDRCRENEYDIIFMDCQMPEMDGFEATRTIRDEQVGAARRVPIVALTANAMDSDHDQCIGAGMDDFLIKPANQDAIAQALQRWVPPSRRVLAEADADA